jgi:hypothetical protein
LVTAFDLSNLTVAISFFALIIRTSVDKLLEDAAFSLRNVLHRLYIFMIIQVVYTTGGITLPLLFTF